MKIIKSNTYNFVNTEPFDIPLPLEFELMSGNGLLASYKIHEDGQVDYSFCANTKERILTSTARPLELNDIYFLFSSRVFQDKTPFTEGELKRFGLEEYNPYEILRKTNGIMPIDRYWIKFPDEDLTYKKAAKQFADYYKPQEEAHSDSDSEKLKEKDGILTDTGDNQSDNPQDSIYSLDSLLEQKSHEYSSIHDAGSILSEGKLDVESLYANIDDEPLTESAFAINASYSKKEATPKEPEEVSEEPEAESSGGNMSPEAIAAMLAATSAEEPAEEVAEEPAKEPEAESSGGNMSPEAIAAMLAATSAEEPAEEVPEELESKPEAAPEVKSEPESSGGNMSPEAIAAMLAAASE